jgi:hypothetical protein
MPRCRIEYIIRLTARLRNGGYKSREIAHETLKYISKLICFIYKIILIIYWDIHAFGSLAPDKSDCIMIVRAVNGTARGDFLKIPITLSRAYLSNESKDRDLPMASH